MKESHFYQALKQITGVEPPEFMRNVTTYDYINLFSDEDNDKLVEWVLSSSNIEWVTSQGVVDAALCLVSNAVDNDNIDEAVYPEHNLCLVGGTHKFYNFGNQKVRRCNNCGCLEE